jgi:hypothetical protein
MTDEVAVHVQLDSAVLLPSEQQRNNPITSMKKAISYLDARPRLQYVLDEAW